MKRDFHAKFTHEFLKDVSKLAKRLEKDRSEVIEELARKGMKAEEIDSARKILEDLILKYKKLEVEKAIEIGREKVRALGSILERFCEEYLRLLRSGDSERAEKVGEQIRNLVWSIQNIGFGGLSPIETDLIEKICGIIASPEKIESPEVKEVIAELREELEKLRRRPAVSWSI